ncbi:MAG: serine hydrolase [Anaerolineae bacterium]
MLRKPLLISVILLIINTLVVRAQESADQPVGIDTLCGESALTITSLDNLPEDAGTQALDLILHQMVQLPSDTVPPIGTASVKPPAPGAVIFVDSPEGRYFRAIGVTDIESCTPLNPETPFPIGSNTKMMTAAVIYQLQEEGLLSTSDLVSKYLPDEIALWDGAESITIDMLLGHTSGLPDYLNSHDQTTVGGRYSAGDWSALPEAYTPEELVTQAATQPLLFAPGAEGRWEYSNTGYIMLGQIIEKVTGKDYINTVTERIIDRLGLKHTVLVADFPPAELGLAGQYLSSPFKVESSGWNFTQAWSAGDAVSTPEDMAVFLRAYYTGALYQNPDTLKAMMTRAATGYALESDQFYYMHGGYYKAGFLGHGGQTLGTESDPAYEPATDTVIVTWANSSEANSGRGVFHVGHALGLTPSWDEVYNNLPGINSSANMDMKILALQDLIGTPLAVTGIYLAGTSEYKAVESGTYTATFNADGQLSIVADCNTVTATYSGEGDSFGIELGASTLVACPEGSLADDFLNTLGAATGIQVISIGGKITVSISTGDQSTITFNAAQ